MPRPKRKLVESGFYHVVLKGSGGQIIFEDDRDRTVFLQYVQEMLSRHDVGLIAWCLMANHVHLLVSDSANALSAAIHDLSTSYAVYFNREHERSGPMFNGRFHSVPIESDEQLMCAVRYIHDNPEKAGLMRAEEYRWSSYQAYLQGRSSFTNLQPLCDLIQGQENFEQFSKEEKFENYRYPKGRRMSDEDAMELSKCILGFDPCRIKSESASERAGHLRLLKDSGITVAQISRLTGIGRGPITRSIAA